MHMEALQATLQPEAGRKAVEDKARWSDGMIGLCQQCCQWLLIHEVRREGSGCSGVGLHGWYGCHSTRWPWCEIVQGRPGKNVSDYGFGQAETHLRDPSLTQPHSSKNPIGPEGLHPGTTLMLWHAGLHACCNTCSHQGVIKHFWLPLLWHRLCFLQWLHTRIWVPQMPWRDPLCDSHKTRHPVCNQHLHSVWD